MKKIYVVFACMALTLVGVASCKKNTVENKPSQGLVSSSKKMNSIAPTGLEYVNWGVYHNEALTVSEHYWLDGSSYDYNTLVKVMKADMSKKYPTFSDISDASIDNAFKDPDFSAIIENRFDSPSEATDLFRKILLNKLNSGIISQPLYDGLYKTFDASLTYEQAMANINNIEVKSLSEAEQNMVTITKSILTNSHDYWSNWSANHVGASRILRRPNNSDIGILVDAIIGFGFSETGPLSILFASVASLAWND